jgi:hypothetical protein
MFLPQLSRPTRGLVVALILSSCALVSLSAGPAALASGSGCRTDPIVLFADGTVVDISTNINADIARVDHVEYTLHAPTGSRVVRVIYTPGAQETLQVFADAPADQFTSDTLVVTLDSGVEVTTTTAALGGGPARRGSASGWNGDHLQVQLTR